MKIAVVGTGISGLTCASLLQHQHDITVFEQDSRIGGHTATKEIELDGRKYAIDTGFIVFNDWTYPNFINLMKKLGVRSRPTTMSFSVSSAVSGQEYGGSSIAALFARRRNWVNPSHWRMLLDIVRFNRESVSDYNAGRLDDGMTLAEYLHRNRYSAVFRDDYLIPMGSAIWSTSLDDMLQMPALFFVRFFKNHGLLSIRNRPQWHVIDGGSKRYLEPLTDGFRDRIRLNTVISHVRRTSEGVVVTLQDQSRETFDGIVFACHSDQALALLADASDDEQQILGSIPYADNEVVLHTDESLLPSRRAAWSAWNYRLTGKQGAAPVLSYNMNMLQGIDSPHTFVVTLNATDQIDPAKILGRYRYAHPQFNPQSVAAQERWQDINGVRHSWFCGAYWRNGFHEDGCVSGIRVANGLGAGREILDA